MVLVGLCYSCSCIDAEKVVRIANWYVLLSEGLVQQPCYYGEIAALIVGWEEDRVFIFLGCRRHCEEVVCCEVGMSDCSEVWACGVNVGGRAEVFIVSAA